MATHSRILAWRILWTEEPGGLQSIGSQRVRHDCSDLVHTRTRAHAHTHTHTHTRIPLDLYSAFAGSIHKTEGHLRVCKGKSVAVEALSPPWTRKRFEAQREDSGWLRSHFREGRSGAVTSGFLPL